MEIRQKCILSWKDFEDKTRECIILIQLEEIVCELFGSTLIFVHIYLF